MTNFWSKYLLPVAVAGFVLAETAGTEALRRSEPADLLRRIDITALQVDTVARDSSAVTAPADAGKSGRKERGRRRKDKKQEAKPQPPKPKQKKQEDIFIWDDDTLIIADEGPLDTIPVITIRDTVPVPDSLRTVDTFLFHWYWAARDSLVHRIVVDSLRASGDSLAWPVIDSLYKADSSAVAKAAFQGRAEALRLRAGTAENPAPAGQHPAGQGQPPGHPRQHPREYAPHPGFRIHPGFPVLQAFLHLAP